MTLLLLIKNIRSFLINSWSDMHHKYYIECHMRRLQSKFKNFLLYFLWLHNIYLRFVRYTPNIHYIDRIIALNLFVKSRDSRICKLMKARFRQSNPTMPPLSYHQCYVTNFEADTTRFWSTLEHFKDLLLDGDRSNHTSNVLLYRFLPHFHRNKKLPDPNLSSCFTLSVISENCERMDYGAVQIQY